MLFVPSACTNGSGSNGGGSGGRSFTFSSGKVDPAFVDLGRSYECTWVVQIRVVIRTIDWTTLDDGARTKIEAAIVLIFYFVLTDIYLSGNVRKRYHKIIEIYA